MATVSVSRQIDAPPADLRPLIADVGAFMRACGFDGVTVQDDLIHIENRVGILTIELTVRQIEREGAVFAYEAAEGPFSEMTTVYELTERNGSTEITARTDFALAVALVGEVMDGTIVSRQRRKELEAQFDWLEAQVA